MGKLVVSQNVCLDGGVQDPIGEDGFDRGGWFTQLTAEDYEAWGKVEYDEALGADALLLGRRTDQFFARGGWNTREGEWAERLRSLPKYVVSSTLDESEWIGGTVLHGDVAREVGRLKERFQRDVVVYGSGQLARTLADQGLVDEIRFTVHPFVLGSGEHIFDGVANRMSVRLVSIATIGTNLVHLIYEIV